MYWYFISLFRQNRLWHLVWRDHELETRNRTFELHTVFSAVNECVTEHRCQWVKTNTNNWSSHHTIHVQKNTNQDRTTTSHYNTLHYTTTSTHIITPGTDLANESVIGVCCSRFVRDSHLIQNFVVNNARWLEMVDPVSAIVPGDCTAR